MKNILKFLLIAVIAFLIPSAVSGQEKDETGSFLASNGESYWSVDVGFGLVAGFEESNQAKIGDKVNIGASLAIMRTFQSNLFLSSGITFSTIEDSGLWENPLDYFSVNLEGGYKIDTNSPFMPFLSIGGSYISAPNTIENSKAAYALSTSVGALMWFKNSKFAISSKWTYKMVNSNYMAPHSQLLFGIVRML